MVVLIPDSVGGCIVIKHPANFVFPLFRDEGGIFENP
jgi:hypothetical protein